MGVFAYTLMTYGLTVVVSLLVVGVIVLVNKAVNASEKKGGEEE